MTSRPPYALPLLLLILGACSASAPSASLSATAQKRGGAAALTSAPSVRESAHALTSHEPGNLEVSQGPVQGSQHVRVVSGYSEVVLARTNPDGTVSTRCVDTPGGADEFLDGTSPSGLVKAAQ